MDFSLVHIIIAIIGALGAWNAFIEKRLNTMYKQVIEKIEDKQALNTVIQEELKNQVVRLEAKIDMLIQLNMQRRTDDK